MACVLLMRMVVVVMMMVTISKYRAYCVLGIVSSALHMLTGLIFTITRSGMFCSTIILIFQTRKQRYRETK